MSERERESPKLQQPPRLTGKINDGENQVRPRGRSAKCRYAPPQFRGRPTKSFAVSSSSSSFSFFFNPSIPSSAGAPPGAGTLRHSFEVAPRNPLLFPLPHTLSSSSSLMLPSLRPGSFAPTLHPPFDLVLDVAQESGGPDLQLILLVIPAPKAPDVIFPRMPLRGRPAEHLFEILPRPVNLRLLITDPEAARCAIVIDPWRRSRSHGWPIDGGRMATPGLDWTGTGLDADNCTANLQDEVRPAGKVLRE
jgi:hypothetical protein